MSLSPALNLFLVKHLTFFNSELYGLNIANIVWLKTQNTLLSFFKWWDKAFLCMERTWRVSEWQSMDGYSGLLGHLDTLLMGQKRSVPALFFVQQKINMGSLWKW